MTIIFTEPFPGADPDKTCGILVDFTNGIVYQSVIHSIGREELLLGNVGERNSKKKQEEYSEGPHIVKLIEFFTFLAGNYVYMPTRFFLLNKKFLDMCQPAVII
jgi:hypothetical protein